MRFDAKPQSTSRFAIIAGQCGNAAVSAPGFYLGSFGRRAVGSSILNGSHNQVAKVDFENTAHAQQGIEGRVPRLRLKTAHEGLAQARLRGERVHREATALALVAQ